MSILARPDLKVDVAFHSSPFLALDDPALVWTDISPYVELDKGMSIQRRRATELDEASPGTLSLTLNNTDGRFTRLRTSSPYYPNVKANRLIRVRALWDPATSVNLVNRRQATGGQADPATVGFHIPSGTQSASIATATANATGTTATLKCSDADAADMEVGDVVTLSSGGVLDTFTRTVAAGWGTADTGNVWSTSGGPAGDYSVNGSSGRVSLSTLGTRYFTSTTGPSDVVVSVDATLPVTATGDSISAAVITRRTDDDNFYIFQLAHTTTGFIHLEIYRRVAGGFTLLAQQLNAITYAANVPTHMQLRCAGSTLSMKAWSGATEPASYALTVTDTTFTTGGIGTHSNLFAATTNPLPVVVSYDNFTATAVTPVSSTATYRQVTGLASAAGTTTITFTPAASSATIVGDVATRYRVQWDTGNQAATGARLSLGTPNTNAAGPDAIAVTAGLSYTWSFYAKRAVDAISVSPRVLWYDKTGALLSESTGPTTALTTSLQRLTFTATAPALADHARPAVANESVLLPSAVVGYRAGVTAKTASLAHPGSLPITQPAGVRVGDGLLLWVNVDSAAATVTTPTGWTLVGDRVGAGSRSYLFRKVASSTDAGSLLTITTTGVKVVAIYNAYSGADTTNPVHQFASVAEVTYGTAHVTPNVTTTVANCWVISAVFDRNSTTSLYTQPAGDTLRASVYNTGSAATVGAVSDNNAPVAAGTYGSKTWTGNRSTDDATMWTVAVRPSVPAASASASLIVTGLQFEQAATASGWGIPSTVYTRFVGHVDSWPTNWEGGVRALTTITATDRQKPLSDAKVRAAITEQVLYSGPVAYYPLGEASDATSAGNTAATPQPSLPIVTRGTVTDEMLQFGAGTGPGTDAQPALVLTPTSGTVGKALRGPLTTPLGGSGVTGLTVAVIFKSSSAAARNHTIAGADDGNPSDGGAAALLDITADPSAPSLRVHLKLSDGIDTSRTSVVNWFDGRTHMAVGVANLAEGLLSLSLYVDGVSQGTYGAPATSITEFPELIRANVGCGAVDAITNLYSGTVSHAMYWNKAITLAQAADMWTAARDGFAGDLPGARAGRIATWGALTATAFDTGEELLLGHPSTEASLLDAFKLIARTEGGPFFLSRTGAATLHARSRRVNAVSAWTIGANAIDGDMRWVEDPQLVANDVTVKYGDNEVHAADQASKDDYGTQAAEPLETLALNDTRAINRANAYLTRYREPISRPDPIGIQALLWPELIGNLLAAEIGTKFTVTDLPVGAPAATADLFVEGVGEDINHETWKFTLDASPAGFDFGLILDDPIRGLLDSNYVGF